MIRTLVWKDVREQLALWGAILFLAVLICAGTQKLRRPAEQKDFTTFFLYTLVVAQGACCGAQLLANEKEAGTLAFLDGMPSLRYHVWHTKVKLGFVLTLLQIVLSCGVALAFRLPFWQDFHWLVLTGLLALCFGLLGGAIFDKVLPAIFVAALLSVVDLMIMLNLPMGRVFFEVVFAVLALWISKQRFCATDRGRHGDIDPFSMASSHRRHRASLSPEYHVSRIKALLWLTEKQGRWLFWPGLGLSIVAGYVVAVTSDFFMTHKPSHFDSEFGVDFWPLLITLAIGLTCGLATFAPEQPGEQERFSGRAKISRWHNLARQDIRMGGCRHVYDNLVLAYPVLDSA